MLRQGGGGARGARRGVAHLANNPFVSVVVVEGLVLFLKKGKSFVKRNSERSDLATEVINFKGNPAAEL